MGWFGNSNAPEQSSEISKSQLGEQGHMAPSNPSPESLSVKASSGSGDPNAINDLLIKKLGEDSMIAQVLTSNPYFAAVCVLFSDSINYLFMFYFAN